MHTGTADQRPSQVTGAYWIFAHAPGQHKPQDGRSGKWMLFVPAQQVDTWWARIRAATGDGSLGIAAKAATARPNPLETSPRTRLICVYTRDWQDRDDVRRVLVALRDLGVPWRLAYKTDEATSTGVYGRGSSVYVSPPGSRDFEDRPRLALF
jgi:Basophilic leukemia-expressed protein Bles03